MNDKIDKTIRCKAKKRKEKINSNYRFAHEMNGNWYKWSGNPTAYPISLPSSSSCCFLHPLPPSAFLSSLSLPLLELIDPLLRMWLHGEGCGILRIKQE